MAASATAPAPPHALMLPYPAQGHVIPFMELAHRFLDGGFGVTFVNTDFNHRRVVAADAAATSWAGPSSSAAGGGGGRLRLVAVADGVDDAGDRENIVLLNAAMQEAIPPQLEALLDGEEGLGKVTCVVVDVGMSFALDVVKRRGISSAALWPASAAVLSAMVNGKNLIRDGVIDDDGAPLNLTNNSFRLTESTEPMDVTFLAWNYMGNHDAERMLFHYLATVAQTAATKADYLLCNTFADIEPSIFTEPTTTIIPIGPLRTWQRPSSMHAPVGHFWHAEYATCMSFLDAQPQGSVVYVAFGSISIMTEEQVQELAFGLKASGRPFLWVVRPEQDDKLPIGFTNNVDGLGKGKVVGWAPQEQVLGHPSLGCFVTHCGWNSTLEGIRNGLPMMCWPYFLDQVRNQTYICDIWKVGLRVVLAKEGGLVEKERIIELLDRLFEDEGVKARVLKLKEMAESTMGEEGASLKILNALIENFRR